jgi:hypothetical protein
MREHFLILNFDKTIVPVALIYQWGKILGEAMWLLIVKRLFYQGKSSGVQLRGSF